MKIYIKGLHAHYWNDVVNKYVSPTTSPLKTDELKEQQENIQALEAIVSTLFDFEYIDVHGLETAFEVWEKLDLIYGGDEHVQREK